MKAKTKPSLTASVHAKARHFKQAVDEGRREHDELHRRMEQFVKDNIHEIFLADYASHINTVANDPHRKQEYQLQIPCVSGSSVAGVYAQAVYKNLKEYLTAAGFKLKDDGIAGTSHMLWVFW